jgi:hypothetical protein
MNIFKFFLYFSFSSYSGVPSGDGFFYSSVVGYFSKGTDTVWGVAGYWDFWVELVRDSVVVFSSSFDAMSSASPKDIATFVGV